MSSEPITQQPQQDHCRDRVHSWKNETLRILAHARLRRPDHRQGQAQDRRGAGLHLSRLSPTRAQARLAAVEAAQPHDMDLDALPDTAAPARGHGHDDPHGPEEDSNFRGRGS